MLNADSIKASFALSKLFSDKNTTVIARPSTIIAELVSNSQTNIVSSIIDNLPEDAAVQMRELDNFAECMQESTQGTLEKPSIHDKVMDDVEQVIKNYVLNHISFAKNVVKPVIIEVSENVVKFLNKTASPSAAGKFNVVSCQTPEILEDISFLDTLSYFKGKPPVNPSKKLSFSVKSANEIFSLLLTGENGADADITNWYSRLGEEFFLNVWNCFFCEDQIATPSKYINFDDIMAMDVFEKTDVALAIYLLANKLFDQVEKTDESLSLSAYKNLVAETRDFAGAILADSIMRINAMDKLSTVVISIDEANYSARVYNKNYTAWLNSGGSVEVILGLIVSGKQMVSSSVSLNEFKEELLDHWKSFTVFYSASENNKSFDYFKEAIRLELMKTMNNFSPEEKEFIDKAPDYESRVKVYLDEELEKLVTKDMEDVFSTVLKIVTRARFYYTDAESILTDIVEVGRINPNADVREAALIATINYVADYISSQMTLMVE